MPTSWLAPLWSEPLVDSVLSQLPPFVVVVVADQSPVFAQLVMVTFWEDGSPWPSWLLNESVSVLTLIQGVGTGVGVGVGVGVGGTGVGVAVGGTGVGVAVGVGVGFACTTRVIAKDT